MKMRKKAIFHIICFQPFFVYNKGFNIKKTQVNEKKNKLKELKGEK